MRKAKALILALALSASSCGSLTESYVAADEATHQAIAPEYLRYVEADSSLSPDQKARRRTTVETWRKRLQSARRSVSSSSSASPSRR